MIRNPGFHRRRNAQRRMNPRKIVIDEVNRQCMLMIFDLLAVRIR